MAVLQRDVDLYLPAPNKNSQSAADKFLGDLLERLTVNDEVEIAQVDDAAVGLSINGLVTETIGVYVNDLTKKRGGKRYMKKSDFDALNTSMYGIPASFAGLEAQMIPTRLQDQLFRIVSVEEDDDGVTITARHVWYDNLENYTLWKPDKDTKYTCAQVCRNILDNAISPVSSRVASDCKEQKIGKDLDFERKNLVEAFLDPEKGVCAKFDLSIIRNNWDFYCLKEVGYDRGIVIQNSKNMLGVTRTESIENLATRIVPIAKNQKGDIVWLDYNGKKYIDSQYINDYSYPRAEIYDTGLQIGKDGVTSSNIQEKMLEAAQKHFTDDKVDLPEVEMTVEFLSLGDTEEYAQYRDLDKVYLHDIITVKETERGYNFAAQVIGVEHDILTGALLSVTIGKITNASASRKIATWQVPEVDGTNIRLKSILAGSFESEAIQAEDIGYGVIAYAHIAQATIDELTTDALTAATAHIHELIAGSITAEDIVAGSITTIALASGAITTDKLDAGAVTAQTIAADAITSDKILAGAVTALKIASGAVTTDKLDAGAVTADKIAANAINADKIDATEISAINAKLGTADIADARIALADIDFAKVKDLNAQSAYFGQAVFQEAVGGKLFVPRLMVGYAQMVQATIGDLVIKATDDNYYHLDVDVSTGAVTATQVTPTQEEINAGHTLTGQTIIDTDILAENLSTANIYATHALMDEVNANIISADRLFAREATIAKINALDLSSNTYIASTIGNWQSGSTITQTINSLDSRIASLGYGTIYYSDTEPSHSGLTEGDIWVLPITDNTWDSINDLTWNYLHETMDWEEVLGKYKMYVWTGTQWKVLYSSEINANMSTQIAQNTYAITLKADQSTVDVLSGDISAFEATLEVQSQAIEAAVESVNAKVSSYVMWSDPTLTEEVTVGDIWIKSQGAFGSWLETKNSTWQTLKNNFVWKDALGSGTYVWDGTQWVQTADRATEVYHSTQIRETAEAISLEAQARAQLGNELVQTRSQLIVTNSKIESEVERAKTAESTKIAKTSRYQTADAIVTEAVSQAGVNAGANYIAKTTSYQTATAIVNEAVRQAGVNAASGFIAKTTSYQTADAIVTEAVRQARVNANSAYIAKTTAYQSADSIVTEAVRQSTAASSGAFIEKTTLYQSAAAIVAAAESYTDSNAYLKKSGISIAANGLDLTGAKHINLDVDANNYVHMSNAGIEMKGSRVSVNGKDMWARDDIIVLKRTDNEQTIINSMSGQHDWVLIKPYYNATIEHNSVPATINAGLQRAVYFSQAGGASSTFGDNASWYKYTIHGTARRTTGSQSTQTIEFRLSNSPMTSASSTPTVTISGELTLSTGTTTTVNINSGQLTGAANNLCKEGSTIYCYVWGDQAGNPAFDIQLKCECSATTSKVPCTVYYFT